MVRQEPMGPDVDDETLRSAVDPRRDHAIRERLEPGVGFEHSELRSAGGDVVGRDLHADPDRGRDPFARRLVPRTTAPYTGARLAPARAATARGLVLGRHAGQASDRRHHQDRRKP